MKHQIPRTRSGRPARSKAALNHMLGLHPEDQRTMVYFVHDRAKRMVKVGMSGAVGQRMLGFKGHRRADLHKVGIVVMPDRELAKLLEAALHRALRHLGAQIGGEWYRLSASQAKKICDEVSLAVRIKPTPIWDEPTDLVAEWIAELLREPDTRKKANYGKPVGPLNWMPCTLGNLI